MEGYVFSFKPFGGEVVEQGVGEVQARCGCRYRAFVVSVDGLVTFVVAFLRLTVQVGGEG